MNDNNGSIEKKYSKRVIVAFGTRPEAIKMAPVIMALQNEVAFEVKTVVTGQHREMLDQVLDLFQLIPDYDLKIMAPGQNLASITSRILLEFTPILQNEKPDLVMVHGDTSTTLACSLAAFYQKIPVAHIEAGLRTGDKWQPYPEEINRLLTGQIADLHFAPTLQAQKNLLRENIRSEMIYITGNTVIDALYHCLTINPNRTVPSEKTILVTAHRRENWGEPMMNIISALQTVLLADPDVRMLIPVHLNPLVRQMFFDKLGSEPRVSLVEPLDYQQMVQAMNEAYLIVTDSGGIQEEAPALGKPVLVLRNKTERPEAVSAGTVKLVGTEPETISQTIKLLLHDGQAYQQMAQAQNPYGDGKASDRIIAGLKYYFKLVSNRPTDFTIL